MKRNCHCKSIHQKPEVIMSLALSHYNFSTPEIRLLLRQVLGHAPWGRTIKRLARSAGHKLKRGRPLTTPNVHKGDLNDLVELTSNGLEACSGNTLQFFHNVQVQFGLMPRQLPEMGDTGCSPRNVFSVTGFSLPKTPARDIARVANSTDGGY